jgi:hypothetical protein
MTLDAETLADAIEIGLAVDKQNARSIAWIRNASGLAQHTGNVGVDLAVNAMRSRSLILGDRYPFAVADAGIRCTADALSTTYGALLMLTTGSPVYPFPSGAVSEGAELLEHLVAKSVRQLLGEGAKALRFGYPGDRDRPPEFPRAIPWLAEQMGLRPADAYRAPSRKDGGVDVIGWRPFPDGRTGFPIVLVQVTLEHNFLHKAGDINVRLWSILLGLDVDPTTALAIPRTVPRNEKWNEVATRSILLERLRISGLVEAEPEVLSEQRWRQLLERIARTHSASFVQLVTP